MFTKEAKNYCLNYVIHCNERKRGKNWQNVYFSGVLKHEFVFGNFIFNECI